MCSVVSILVVVLVVFGALQSAKSMAVVETDFTDIEMSYCAANKNAFCGLDGLTGNSVEFCKCEGNANCLIDLSEDIDPETNGIMKKCYEPVIYWAMFHQRSEPVQLGCKNKKQREKARNENRKRQRNQRKYKNQSKTTPKQKTNINKGPVYTFEGDTNVVGIVYPGGKSIAEYNDTELSN